MNRKAKIKNAFTLAEVLITLGVIGVVAAVTMPTLVTNIQEKARKEQVRTVKYKLTKAIQIFSCICRFHKQVLFCLCGVFLL